MATDNITLGRGELFFNQQLANGSYEGFREIGNTPAFGLTVQSEFLKHYSSKRGVRKQDRETAVQTDYSATFTTDNINYENLAAMLLGTTSILAQSSATGSTQQLVSVKKDRLYQIGVSSNRPEGLRNITVTAVTVAASSKTAGTDYSVDSQRGTIYIIPTGTIADGATVDITYSVGAHSRKLVVSAANVIRGQLMFHAHNAEGEDIDYLMRNVTLTPNGEFQLIQDNAWNQIAFNAGINEPSDGGALILANGQPYTPA